MTNLPIYIFLIAILIVAFRTITKGSNYLTPKGAPSAPSQKEVTGVMYVYPKVKLEPHKPTFRRAKTESQHTQHEETLTQRIQHIKQIDSKEEIRTWIKNMRELDQLRQRTVTH